MADISNELDRIAAVIAEKSNKAVEEVVNSLIELVQGKTSEEALEILSSIDLKYVMGLKMSSAVGLYEAGAVSILTNMYSTSMLSESTLRLLLDNSKRLLVTEFVDKMADNILLNTYMGISQQLTPTEILKSIGDVTPNIETQIITAYGQYSSAVTNFLSENLPKDTEYIYIGAYDSKTRDRCVEKIGYSPATRKEIVSRFGDFNNEIWNCRHRWEQRSSSPKDQGFNKDKFVDA